MSKESLEMVFPKKLAYNFKKYFSFKEMLMINILVKNKQKSELDKIVELVCEDSFSEFVEKNFMLKDFFAAHKFKAKSGQSVLLFPTEKNDKQKLFVGLSTLTNTLHENLEEFRNALGHVVTKMSELEWENASFFLSKNKAFEQISNEEWLTDVVTSLHLANYKFKDFKSKHKNLFSIKKIEVFVDIDLSDEQILNSVKMGEIIGEGVNFTRQLANLPPNIANPEYIAQKACEAAAKFGFECVVYSKSEIKEMGMGGVLAVGSGSANECKFVELKLNSKSKTTRTVALVGKGVTFDTGGVSLKPAKAMHNMKFDMSGAVAVLGVFVVLAQLGCPVNLVGMMPLVENMPDGASYRQDDIVTHYGGITSEIDNTDAEGRLILADGIAYAEAQHKPELIIDIATLTGACVVALGHFFTGMMGNDKQLMQKLASNGELCGEPVWELPSINLYDRAIESNVADIINCGKGGFDAGAITAGMFLKRFVKQAKWIHLDIAGTECDLPIHTYLGSGATGVGVRLLSNFLKQL